MNEAPAHLVDDIERVCHSQSNVGYGFVVHLHRFSAGEARFSARDWSPKSKRITPIGSLSELVRDKPVEVWYATADQTGTHRTGVWQIPPSGPVHEVACAQQLAEADPAG
jgi:hypothetical protein